MYDHILVPTDGSTGTADVALQAIDLAEAGARTRHDEDGWSSAGICQPGHHLPKGFIRPRPTVVQAVAAVRGTEPSDLPPLYGTVDPDALDSLVTSISGSGYGTPTDHVEFRYDGWTVPVGCDGMVTVSRRYPVDR
jgi:hypothetical protein